MPLNFPQIDPYGAPPPAPAPYGQPQFDLSGLQGIMSSFGDTAQGLIDRNMGNPTQPGMSGDYLDALLSGGTQSQNDRFSAMFAPRRFQGEVAAELANDPVFGGAFASQGQPSVTQFAAPQQPAAGPITNDSISQMMNQGQIDGRSSGVSVSPQQTSLALQNRLDDRADRQAFNQRNFTVNQFAGADPTKVLGMMYEAALAEQQMQSQSAEMAQKERMARWLGESEMGLKRDELAMRGRGIDADIAQAEAEQQRLASQDAWSRETFGMSHDLDKQRLATEGQLSQKDLLGLILGEAGQSMGGPSEMIPLLRQLGVNLPAGMGASPLAPAAEPASLLGSKFGGVADADLRLQLKQMPAQQAFDYLTTTGAKGRPLSPDEALSIVNELHPKLVGNTVADPDGLGMGGWEILGAMGGPLHYLGGAAANGTDLDAIFGGMFSKPSKPVPASSLPLEMSLSF